MNSISASSTAMFPKYLREYSLLFLSSLVLLLAAMYNGYPIVYSDTSTYLSSGFELETPADRPITYGLFVRVTSLNGLSLWLTVFLQSLLLVWIVKKLVDALGFTQPHKITFFSIFICTITTGLSWVTSQLIADVFTPMLILLWAIVYLDSKASGKTLFLYGFLILFVSSMHMSHFLMTLFFAGFSFILMLFKPFRHLISVKKIILIAVASTLSFLSFSSAYAKYHNVFLVARLDETGILKQVLDDKCPQSDYRLCEYKDSLPGNAITFLWDARSPLQKLGGNSEIREEFKRIVHVSTTESKYLQQFVACGFRDAFRQTYHFDVGDGNGIFMKGTLLHERINKYVPREAPSYASSKQQSGRLSILSSANALLFYFMLAAGLALVFVFAKKSLPRQFKFVFIVFLGGIAINNFVCAAFSSVSDRYGCRVMWLLVLSISLALGWYYQREKVSQPKAQ